MSKRDTRRPVAKPRPIDKPLPSDPEAEIALLGSLLLDRDAIIPVATVLRAGDRLIFASERHQQIGEAMLACYDRGEPSDLINVGSELRRREQLDSIGGYEYLIRLSNSVPTAVHAEYYAENVAGPAVRRALIEAAGKIGQLAYDETQPLEDVLAESEELLFAVAQNRQADDFTTMADLSSRLFEQINQMQNSGDMSTGIPSGFRDIDKLTGGLQRSDLIILAARPAVGKTSLALNIADAVAEQGYRVAIFSLEMSELQLHQRIVSTRTGIDMQKIRTGQVHDTDLQTLIDALGEAGNLPITICDTPGQTITDIRSKARQLKAREGVDLVIVDYLQLMEGGGKDDENRVQAVSKMSRGLKIMARELDVPVIALSQLSRAVETRTSHIPMLSDLRDSGAVEQDADQVWFIYREELYDPETDKKGIAELHIAKHRNGPTGVVPLRFFKSTTKFANLETYRQLDGY